MDQIQRSRPGHLNVVKQTVPLTGAQRRRVDEAKELVEAAIDIIEIEDDDEYDDDDIDNDDIDEDKPDDEPVDGRRLQ